MTPETKGLPRQLPKRPAAVAGPLLGWSRPGRKERPIGFGASAQNAAKPEPIYGSSTEHHLVVGSTGSGKTMSVVIPNVLDHEGPLIALDVKGEVYRATHRHLERRGCRVVLVDPFGILPGQRTFGFDLIQPVLRSDDPSAAAQSITEMLSPSDAGRDPFWPTSGNNLVAATLHYASWNLARGNGASPQTLSECIDFLHGDDVIHTIAVVLDTVKDLPAEVYRAFATLLQMPDITRGGVLASAQAPLKVLSSGGLRAALSGTELDLAAVTRSDDLAIFIAWPPSALKSHSAALRLMLSVLLDAIFKRSVQPAATTLLMVDEAGTIGPVPQIETAFTLSRGYGCRVTAVFQSIHQLEASYGVAGKTIFDNAGTISVLPPSNLRCAREQADLLGVPAEDLLSMATDEVLVACRGHAPRFLRRPNCLTDMAYRGRCGLTRALDKSARARASK